MAEVYPCRVVICNDEKFAQYYNADPENSLMASYCVTVEEAFDLVKETRNIETIILLNGEGEAAISYLGQQLNWKKKNMPDIVRVQASGNHEDSAKEARAAVFASSALFIGFG